MMKDFIYRAGSVIGRSHWNKLKNNQDAYVVFEAAINGKEYLCGAVADGCSGGRNSRNEVGAILLTAFLKNALYNAVVQIRPDDSFYEIPGLIFRQMIEYLGNVAGMTACIWSNSDIDFILDHLLCTFIGFVMGPDELAVFACGDGMIMINDQVTVFDQGNTPLYPAYLLLEPGLIDPAVMLPQQFTEHYYPAHAIERFAIATDGLTEAYLRDPDLIGGIWDYERGVKAGLKWWLNKGMRDLNLFRDDCTVVAIERAKTDPEDSYGSDTKEQ